jgi:hypothetical protein
MLEFCPLIVDDKQYRVLSRESIGRLQGTASGELQAPNAFGDLFNEMW